MAIFTNFHNGTKPACASTCVCTINFMMRAWNSLGLIEPGPPGPTALHSLWRMQWNTSSFDGVELSELQGTEVKQGESEKSPDTGGTRTLRHQVKSTSLNHGTTSAPPVANVMLLSISHATLAHLRDIWVKATWYDNLNNYTKWQCCYWFSAGKPWHTINTKGENINICWSSNGHVIAVGNKMCSFFKLIDVQIANATIMYMLSDNCWSCSEFCWRSSSEN